MQRRLALVFGLLVTSMVAGCVSEENTPGSPPVTPAAAEEAEARAAEPLPEPPTIEAIPVSWSGRLETGIRVCELQTPSCHTVRPMREDQERTIEGEAGNVLGGQVNFTWQASSPLMAELRAVILADRPDCDDCDQVVLGFAIGPSPLQVSLEGMERPLEDDEVIRMYVRAPYAQFHPPLYLQADLSQDFAVEGQVEIERPNRE
ncbi:MAG: hypothetical protein KY455_00455 [Euryarchaeota archaeon]|nr:hypothetical protein [Euryarchaeota archaeon]